MSEFSIIESIARLTRVPRADVRLGIGDDAAVLRPPRGFDLVVAMDTLVDGVHFPSTTAPAAIGWKALAVNLSDLAAMGASPLWATLALTLPRGDATWVREFARGFATLARLHKVALVGGDTTRGPLTITVQVHGAVPPARALTRLGARAGDDIWVSGYLGDAAAGLTLVQSRVRGVSARDRKALVQRLERPEPRIDLGLALRAVANAAIDVSDGLLADLGHILAAGKRGATLNASALPASATLLRAIKDDEARIALQLSGGDDYEICFTAAPAQARKIGVLAHRLKLPLTRVGRIDRQRGLRLLDDAGEVLKIDRRGWDHFR